MDLFNLLAKSVASDKEASTQSVEKNSEQLAFKRDENGVLWRYNVSTGEKVGRIYEHGNDKPIDTIIEVDEK